MLLSRNSVMVSMVIGPFPATSAFPLTRLQKTTQLSSHLIATCLSFLPTRSVLFPSNNAVTDWKEASTAASLCGTPKSAPRLSALHSSSMTEYARTASCGASRSFKRSPFATLQEHPTDGWRKSSLLSEHTLTPLSARLKQRSRQRSSTSLKRPKRSFSNIFLLLKSPTSWQLTLQKKSAPLKQCGMQ